MTGLQLIEQDRSEEIARYPITDGETVSEAVLGAFSLVADRRDGGEVLYDFVDPDALDQLFEGSSAPTVSGEFWGHPVVVTPDTVTVFERN